MVNAILAQGLSTSIDLGQIIIGTSIGISGYFVKRELDRLSSELDSARSSIGELKEQVSALTAVIGLRKHESKL